MNLDLKSTDKIEDLILRIRQISKESSQVDEKGSNFLLNLRITDKSYESSNNNSKFLGSDN